MKLLDDAGPVGLLIVQPSQFCNIDCKYCYVPGRSDRKIMELSTFETCLRRLFDSGLVDSNLIVAYHSGEPLAVPLSFYRSALEIIQRVCPAGITVTQYFQTNGILITPEWCRYFRQNSVELSVSIDGPAFIHDKNRISRSGRPTHSEVLAGIKLLQETQVRFTTISVITAQTVRFPEEFLQFFLDEDIEYLALSVEDTLTRPSTLLCLKDDLENDFADFISVLYDLYFANKHCLSIREFDFIEQQILYGAPVKRNLQTIPCYIISLGVNGDVFTFSPELHGVTSENYGKFILGNINESTFAEMLETDKFQKIYRDIVSGVVACKSSCNYFSVCGGGVPSAKYCENGNFNSTITRHCEFRFQKLFDVVSEKVGKIVARKSI